MSDLADLGPCAVLRDTGKAWLVRLEHFEGADGARALYWPHSHAEIRDGCLWASGWIRGRKPLRRLNRLSDAPRMADDAPTPHALPRFSGLVTPCGVLPGVTTVLMETRPASEIESLEAWRATVGAEAEERSIQGRVRGRRFHADAARFLSEGVEPAGDEVFNTFRPFLMRCEPVLVEAGVWSSEGFAGVVDLVARVDGVLTVVDWKVTDHMRIPEHMRSDEMQVAAYAVAAREVYGLECERGLVVNGHPKGLNVHMVDLRGAWEGFAARLEQYKAQASDAVGGAA